MTAQARNGSQTELQLTGLETKVDLLIWLHAEQAQQVQRLAVALAGVLAQMAQPQIQQNIVNGLLGPQSG